MNIRTQQHSMVIASTIMVLMIGAMLLGADRDIGTAIRETEHARNIVHGITQQRFLMVEYILHYHERAKVQWRATHESLARSFRSRTPDGSGGQVLVDVLRERHEEIGAAFSRLVENHESRSGTVDEIAASEELGARTRQLVEANTELESFSYSVSHDLRRALRSMDGFSLALLEDYPSRLDDEGRDFLHRIRAASQRMGCLIDDLLGLSRLGRADKALIRIALQNLLDNAWKFTGKSPGATIRVGAVERDGERIIFVADDGAGFDMTHADRLFGAFQRLHHARDFPGTGIGLAIVQRVIRRHDGRIWAEATEGKGATFFFTLGEANHDARG